MWSKVTETFNTLRKRHQPNYITYVVFYQVCGENVLNGSLDVAMDTYNTMPKHFLQDKKIVATLIEMFGKFTMADVAESIFSACDSKDVYIWTAMINAYGINGDGEKALDLYEKMLQSGLRPTVTTFGAVLSAASHAQLVERGLAIYETRQKYGIQADVVMENSIVDLYARSEQIDKAVDFAKNMARTDWITWMSILGACRNQKVVEHGEYAAARLVDINPNETSVYVALSQLYREVGMYEKAKQVRAEIDKLGLKKQPGISTAIINGRSISIHAQSVPTKYVEKIDAWRRRHFELLQEHGYVMDTSVITENVSLSEKETALSGHSEKTGLIIALNETADSTEPIRIFKNLRVCKDCHTATAIASKVYNREVFLQDARRTHHFKDGKCNCGGKW